MISSLVQSLDNSLEFIETLNRVIETHQSIGVRASEYSILAEVFFYSMREVLGYQYNITVSKAWIKVFNRMLGV